MQRFIGCNRLVSMFETIIYETKNYLYRVVSLVSSYLLLSEFDLNDINMDKSGLGWHNSLPYCNTKYCISLFTRELGRRTGVNSYALCPGIVDTPINNLDNFASHLKVFYRLALSAAASTANEVFLFKATEQIAGTLLTEYHYFS